MNTFFEMPKMARAYIALITLLGAAAALQGWARFGIALNLQFAVYFAVAVLASALKVNLPAITGTMSVNSLFILVGIIQLRQGETIAIAVAGVLIQCLWRPKTSVAPVRVIFSCAANVLAVSASYYVFNHPLLAAQRESVHVLATACAYFLVNTSLVAMVVALTERKPVAKVWRECYLWCFPYYLGGAGLAWCSTSLNRAFNWEFSIVLLLTVYLVYRSYEIYLQRLGDEKKHVEEMASMHLRTIEALALAIEAKDRTTHDHLRRVRVYALEIAIRMGLGPLDLQSLRAAALLHDIGKLAVPEYIISKPGKLTKDEFEKMKIHPVVGAHILEQVQFPYPVAPIVLSHHEKWDGTGYPNGLKGQEIPIGARILAAVDCLDALATDRHYRLALPLDRAMDIVAAEAGRAFDPAVIAVLQSCYAELEQKAQNQPFTPSRIDVGTPISRGAAPATGFEQEMSLTDLVADSSDVQPEPLLAAQKREIIQELREWNRLRDRSAGSSSLLMAEMLANYAVRIRQQTPYEALVFYLRRDHHLVPEFAAGEYRALFAHLRIPWGEGLTGWVAENRKPMLNGNPSVEYGYLEDNVNLDNLRSALAVPLETNAGVTGVLALYRRQGNAFSARDLGDIASASPGIALALEQSQQESFFG